MDEQRYFTRFCTLFTEGMFLCCLFAMIGGINSQPPQSLEALPYTLWCGIVGLVMTWFLGKERTVPQLALFGTALWALGSGVVLALSSLDGVTGYAFGLLFVAEPLLRSVQIELKPAGKRQALNLLELSVLGTALMLLAGAGGFSLPPMGRELLVLTIPLNLFHLVRSRVAGGRTAAQVSGRFVGMLGAVLTAGAIALLTMVMIAAASQPARKLLSAFFGGIVAAFTWIGDLLSRGIMWLILLLPPADEGYWAEMQQAALEKTPQAQEALVNTLPPWAAGIALLVILVLAVAAAAALLRGVRVGRIGGKRVKTKAKVRRPGLWSALRRWGSGTMERLRFWLRSVRFRHTPQGLLIRLERWAILHRCPRKPGETCRAFLERIGSQPRFQSGREELSLMAEALDRIYYKGEKIALERNVTQRLERLLEGKE